MTYNVKKVSNHNLFGLLWIEFLIKLAWDADFHFITTDLSVGVVFEFAKTYSMMDMMDFHRIRPIRPRSDVDRCDRNSDVGANRHTICSHRYPMFCYVFNSSNTQLIQNLSRTYRYRSSVTVTVTDYDYLYWNYYFSLVIMTKLKINSKINCRLLLLPDVERCRKQWRRPTEIRFSAKQIALIVFGNYAIGTQSHTYQTLNRWLLLLSGFVSDKHWHIRHTLPVDKQI